MLTPSLLRPAVVNFSSIRCVHATRQTFGSREEKPNAEKRVSPPEGTPPSNWMKNEPTVKLDDHDRAFGNQQGLRGKRFLNFQTAANDRRSQFDELFRRTHVAAAMTNTCLQ